MTARRVGPAGPWALGLGYAAALLLTDTLTRALSDDGGAAARAWLSTNLDTLTGQPAHAVAALLGSAFVAEESVGWWALFGVAGLVVSGRRFGALRAGALALGTHLLATAASEGLLAARIAAGAAPASDQGLLDVGPSYLVVAALVAGVGFGRRWERLAPAAAFALVAPYLFGGLADLQVAPVGHAASVLLALGLGALLVRRGRAARPRAAGSGDAPDGVTR